MNYTLVDLLGSVCAVFLFFFVLFVPGYAIGWISNCLGFRALSVPWRFLISLPLSIAICPIITFWLGSLFSWTAIWLFYLACLLAFLVILAGGWKHERPRVLFVGLSGTPTVVGIMMGTWLVVTILSLVDLQLNHRLYYSTVAYDYTLRTAVTDAITRTGPRPENPFYYLGGPTPLRYHYFWFLLCSIVDRLGGNIVDARQAVIASAVWCGWALMAVVPLFFRFYFGYTAAALRRRSVLAIALFAVTGLDIIPTIILWMRGTVYADMEWWNEQVTSWWGSALWVPHNIAALVTSIFGFLLIRHGGLQATTRQRTTSGLIAGLAFGSAVGLSIYVTFIFALFLSVWTLIALFKRDRAYIPVLITTGLVTVLLAVPYLKMLTGGGHSASGSFLVLTIRTFGPLDEVLRQKSVKTAILRLLVLPLNYFLELGLFFVVGLICLWRFIRKGELERTTQLLLLLLLVSIFVCTFLRSGVIVNNDLGIRGFLPAQFVLLLWAADLFFRRGVENEQHKKGFNQWWLHSALWAPLVILGISGTVYELGILRFHGLLADDGIVAPEFSPDRQMGARNYAFRQSYEELQHILPVTAVIETNPDVWDFSNGLYAGRTIAVYNPVCGTEFGGDTKLCAEIYPKMKDVYTNPQAVTPEDIAALCKRLGISAIFVTDRDTVWNIPRSWVWQMRPAISTQYTRIFLFS